MSVNESIAALAEFVDRAGFLAGDDIQGREDLSRYLEANPLYASLNVKLRAPTDLRTVTSELLHGRDERTPPLVVAGHVVPHGLPWCLELGGRMEGESAHGWVPFVDGAR